MAVRILGVNGGVRPDGSTGRALRYTMERMARDAVRCETFEIGALPVHDGRGDGGVYPPVVGAWRAACKAADALILTVPSRQGGIPGALKNALDYLDDHELAGKPFILIGLARGDAEPGVTDTARVLRHLGAVAAVPDVVVSRSGEHWGSGEEPANEAVGVAITKVVHDLASLCLLRAEGRLPAP